MSRTIKTSANKGKATRLQISKAIKASKEHVIFETPTLLDVRAITTFGINAKPKTKSPIGFFGTGLKYAVAVLCREGCEVTLHIGKKTYIFYVDKAKFRGKDFNFIKMKQGKTIIDLPFTTELGKNWELWQAFRELYSNTIDEKGEVHLDTPAKAIKAKTFFSISGSAFIDEYYKIDEIFLPEGERNNTSGTVQVIKRKSNSMYYRGMRARDLELPSMFTWNILSEIELTEDRTIKHSYFVDSKIAYYIACTCQDSEIIQAVLESENMLESKLDFDNVYSTSSVLFDTVSRMLGERVKNNSAHKYMRMYGANNEEIVCTLKWQEKLIKALEHTDYSKCYNLMINNRNTIIGLLNEHLAKESAPTPTIAIAETKVDLFDESYTRELAIAENDAIEELF